MEVEYIELYGHKVEVSVLTNKLENFDNMKSDRSVSD